MHLIKKEFSNIAKSKTVMLLLAAIILIPFIYSFCFLTSAWDPYGNTGKVPVAVVNLDQPTHLQGKLVNVGAQTVAKLHKDHQLGWHFVSAKEAAKGLKDNKYYTVITIPEDFSKDAATVLDAHPKQMKLSYKTNGSLNYISEVMSQVGTDRLNAQIRAKLTNTFASTLFDQIGQIGKQLGKAATGATQINAGTVTLDNGLNKYTVGVSQVNDGIQTMKISVAPLSSGVQKLTDGSVQLKDGISKYTNGVVQVDGGLGQLHSNIPALSSGVQQLTDGGTQIRDGLAKINAKTTTLPSGVQQLTDGISQIHGGLDTMNSKTAALPSGVQQLTDGSKSLSAGVSQYTGGADQITAGVSKLYDQHETLESGVKTLSDSMNQLYANIYTTETAANGDPKGLIAAVDKIAAGMNEFKTTVIDQNQIVDKVGKLNETVNKQVSTLKMAYTVAGIGMYSMGQSTLNAQLAAIPAGEQAAYSKATAEANKLNAAATDAEGSATAAKTALKAEIAAVQDADTKAKLQAAYDALDKADSSATTANTKVRQGFLFSSGVFDVISYNLTTTGTDAAGDPAGLQGAVNKLNTGLTTPTASGETFASAINKLNNALAELNTKIGSATDSQYTSTKFKNPQTVASAVSSITDGMNQLETSVGSETDTDYTATGTTPTTLSDALKALYNGTQQLSANSAALNDGSVQLNGGLNTLNASAPQLADGVTKLLNGSAKEATGLTTLNGQAPQLADGIVQLLDGSTREATGLTTLNGQVPTLASGVNQLYAGSQQLVANNAALNSGASQLAGGLTTLNNSVPTLMDGVDQLSAGTKQLVANNQALTDGTGKLKDGSKQLADGLVSGSKQVNGVKLSQATAKMFAEPSTVKQTRLSTVPNYGDALAPYVLALALFIAIIIFNFAYPMRRNDGYKTVAEWLKAKLAIGTLVAVAMALIEASLMLVVGLHVDHIAGFYGLTLLFSLSAMYLTQFLNLAFGGFGIFAALGLLTMSGSGGLFPAETISPLYNAFQKFLPMTYAINGYREVITSGIAGATVAQSVFVLVGVAVVSLLLMIPAVKHLLGTTSSIED